MVAFVLLGVAITVGAVLMIVIPVAVGLALIASLFRTAIRPEPVAGLRRQPYGPNHLKQGQIPVEIIHNGSPE